MGLLGVAFATTAACASGPAPDPAPPAQAAAPASAAGASDVQEGYRLGAGDKVKITVFNEPTLTGDVVVDGQGNISMPLIGEVVVKNLTVRELERLIAAKLKDGWVRDPQVSAEMTSYRPYYILGEITKPGEYPFISGLTVMKAVASAGDFTYRADKKKVFIKSIDSPNEREVRLTPSTLVKPGDTIRIRERFF
ncbi:MAG: polysaccharide export protein [Alphaproteobacteria bacterium]|nr:polysaccharide export protein [Alphaproteobacteria bacterium]